MNTELPLDTPDEPVREDDYKAIFGEPVLTPDDAPLNALEGLEDSDTSEPLPDATLSDELDDDMDAFVVPDPDDVAASMVEAGALMNEGRVPVIDNTSPNGKVLDTTPPGEAVVDGIIEDHRKKPDPVELAEPKGPDDNGPKSLEALLMLDPGGTGETMMEECRAALQQVMDSGIWLQRATQMKLAGMPNPHLVANTLTKVTALLGAWAWADGADSPADPED